jgi:ubiquinone/menaquinone biosynthesis C-methylase UbiE
MYVVRVVTELELSRDNNVIDLGCGDARWLCRIAQLHNCGCWGIDMDEERVKVAIKNIADVSCTICLCI